MHPTVWISLGHLLMDNPASRSHPLNIAGSDRAMVSHAVSVLNRSGEDIRNSLDPAVWVPWKACQVIFRNDVPEDYLAGFPWHPHRGIETITYVLAGTVEHGDSMGNHGAIAAGDIQWMTAGSGIIHQEMPKGDPDGRMHGFQLWANLPSSLKMTPPRYQEVKSPDIPLIKDDDGTGVRIVCGTFWGKKGPVDGIAADPIYLDVSVPPGRRKTLPVETTRHAFAYVFAGSGNFCNASGPLAVPTEPVGWWDKTPPAHADN